MEISWAECKSLLFSAKKKKNVDAVIALVVTDIIIASISLEPAQVKTLVTEPASLPELAPVLQKIEGANKREQPKKVP